MWIVLSVAGADPLPISGPTIQHHIIFMVFQLMGVAATLALVWAQVQVQWTTFNARLRFSFRWSVMISCPAPVGFWGGGWLDQRSAMNGAGQAVRPLSSGISVLTCA